ncbi:MAG: lipase family protein [Ectothiorhodospiraceae bacterium AqS1]|nr:lipase family protein [Ectothiorhodospiraceae bacterium AqS1]|eukprot:XP_011407110.1 PREDICTED: lipase ZK262.3-like [Amphimedon queenslandica]
MLVFRGTEKNCFKDIKADIDAVKIGCVSNGGVHRGFKNHYEKIANRIQNDLNKKEYIRKPLIIAGHSLGGALATIAAKRLIHQGGIAACYTFGAPRVGDEKWSHDVKTPIYRLVNAADCVTMLPPGGFVMDLLQMLSGSIPIVGKFIKNYLINFKGYYHIGDIRYLTSCKSGQYANVNLLYAVPSLRRMHIYFNKKIASKFIADHSISIYRRKLAIIAYKRNKTD